MYTLARSVVPAVQKLRQGRDSQPAWAIVSSGSAPITYETEMEKGSWGRGHVRSVPPAAGSLWSARATQQGRQKQRGGRAMECCRSMYGANLQ